MSEFDVTLTINVSANSHDSALQTATYLIGMFGLSPWTYLVDDGSGPIQMNIDVSEGGSDDTSSATEGSTGLADADAPPSDGSEGDGVSSEEGV